MSKELGIPEKSRKKVILWVDDDTSLLNLIKVINRRYDTLEFITESNGLVALKKLEPINPDIIVLDINMPEIDGIKMCRIIRRVEQFKKTRIIAYTSSTGLSDIKQIQGAGFTEYFNKSMSFLKFIEYMGKF